MSARPSEKNGTLPPAFERELRDRKLASLATMAEGVAHDFNNYLTTIVGNNEIVLRHLPDDARVKENARQIASAASMAVNLTNEIILYASRAGRTPERVDLAVLISETAENLRSTLRGRTRLEFHSESDMPQVLADREQVRMIAQNMLANAADVLVDAEDGTVEIGVGTVECSREMLDETHIGRDLKPGLYAYIEVRDNGGGIPAAAMERMYDPFFSTKLRGRGMGLPVAVGILRAHRGTIGCKVLDGVGSVVRALLPCAEHSA